MAEEAMARKGIQRSELKRPGHRGTLPGSGELPIGVARPGVARLAIGARVISSATTVDKARLLEAAGCQASIAQGIEASGHRGMLRTDPGNNGNIGNNRPAALKIVEFRMLPALLPTRAIDSAGVSLGTVWPRPVTSAVTSELVTLHGGGY
jgi:hypothetical protein